MKKYLLPLLAVVMVFAISCSSSTPTNSSDPVSVQIQPLSVTVSGVTFCASGSIDITGPTTVSIPTTCASPNPEVILLPGSYTATISGLDCSGSGVPPGAQQFVNCTLNPPQPVPFTVTAGGTVNVPFSITYNYLGLEPFSILFTVGSAVISIGQPTTNITLNLCGLPGQYVICEAGRACATVDGAGPACYADCTGGANLCGALATCMPVAGTGIDGGPTVVPPGTLAALSSILHVCVPAAQSGIAGASSGGAGGAPAAGAGAGGA